jgi:hypothetical protein
MDMETPEQMKSRILAKFPDKPKGRPPAVDENGERVHPARKTIEKEWAENWAALSEEEQQRLRHEVDIYNELKFFMTDVVFGVRNDRIAGHPDLQKGMCYPLLTASLVIEHVASFPRVNSFCPDASSARAMLKLEGDSWDDTAYKDFGLFTRLWSPLVLEFMEVVLDYATKHPDFEDVAGYAAEQAQVAAYLDEHLPEWKKRIREEKRKNDALIKEFRLAEPEKIAKVKAKASAKLDEQNTSLQTRQREEERNEAAKLVNGWRSAEKEIWQRGGR